MLRVLVLHYNYKLKQKQRVENNPSLQYNYKHLKELFKVSTVYVRVKSSKEHILWNHKRTELGRIRNGYATDTERIRKRSLNGHETRFVQRSVLR